MNPGPILFVLGRLSAQAAVVVVAILLVQALFRKCLAPGWRSACWLLLVARLLLPVSPESQVSVFNLSPFRRLPANLGFAEDRVAPALPAAATVPVETGGTTEGRDAPVRLAPGARSANGAPAGRELPAPRPMAIPDLLHSAFFWGSVWLAGLAAFLTQVAFRSGRWKHRFAGSPTVSDPAVVELVAECTERLGIRSRPAIFESRAVASPVLYGVFRPRLVLPRGFVGRFTREEIRFVVLHEMVHLKRGDLIINWLTTGLQAIHWFNPLVWLGFSRWRADRELACDAAVLEIVGAGRNRDYGETIIQLLEGCAHQAAIPGRVGVLEAPDQLRSRLAMIVKFKPASRWSAAAIILLMALAAGCLTNPPGTPQSATKPAVSPVVSSPAASHVPSARTDPTPAWLTANQAKVPIAPAKSRESSPPFIRMNGAIPAAMPSPAPVQTRAVAGDRAPKLTPHLQAATASVNLPKAKVAAGRIDPPTLPILVGTAKPAAKSDDPIFVGGVGATGTPYGLSPLVYARVSNLQESIALTDSQMATIGTLFMREDHDKAALGRNPPPRAVAQLHKRVLNQIRTLLTPGQCVQFNLLPSSYGGGLVGMNPWNQLDRLNRLVSLTEAQKWPLLQAYVADTEKLMECQTPELAPQAKAARLALLRDVRGLLTPEQRKIWDATPRKDGGGMLVSSN